MFASTGARVGIFAAGVGATSLFFMNNTAECSDVVAHPPAYPWSHRQAWQAFDHDALRRGHQIYQQVCATCHSLNHRAFRHLVGVCYTEAEAKAIAKNTTIMDGPDEEGEMFERPGVLADYFPKPYPNDNAARFANNGALPPDLSYVVNGRPAHDDYVFALLTGYCEPPAGITVREGLYYNPYFPGGKLAMAPALSNGMIDFPDGTPNNISQLAKDVTTFLTWTSNPEQDERRRLMWKTLVFITIFGGVTLHWKRFTWNMLKTRVIDFRA